MTFSPSDFPFGNAKSATGFEPFMAAAFAPAMMTGTMMMQGYAFWMSAARGFMPMLNEAAAPVVAMPAGIDLAETLLSMPVGIDVPETVVAKPVFIAHATGRKPIGLSEARDGACDDLKLISGIGPKIERQLHDLGIYHWDQIADWKDDEVIWVDGFLNFKGRIDREEWIAQAEALALGGHEEYVKRFGKEPR